MIMDDKNLLLLLFDRNDQAFPTLAQRFGNRLYRTAYNILGSAEDAEEVVNDTYFAIWNAIPPERPEPLDGYVYRTGRNIALKKYRFLSAQKRCNPYDCSLEELSQILPGGSMEEDWDVRALGQAIDRFLDRLPRLSRVLFLRRYWFGDQIKSLAEEFSMTESAVSVRLSRIRQQLKAYLLKEGFFL
jgi:RNA polymerase sigma-70 factor (ECF subfamily)